MTTFTTVNTQIESLYVGYFGRAADPAGLQYWANQLNAGTTTLAAISASFAVQPEAIAKYPYLASPTISDPTTFVQSVYSQLFGHAADAAGLAYWVGQLNAAKGSPSAVGQMILNIISGATGTDNTIVTNRVTVATDFTAQASNAGTTFTAAVSAQSSAEIATVTDTAASVTAAIAATTAFIASAPGPQQNFTLGIDTLTSSAQNANFNSQLIFNAPGGALVQSLQTGDSAVDTAPLTGTGLSNGGTFTAMLNSGAVTPLVTLQGIPTHTVTSITAGSGYAGSSSGITGLVTLNNTSSTGSLTIGAAGAGIDKGGVAGTTTTGATLLSTVNLNNVTAGATTVFVNAAALAGAADVLGVNVVGPLGATGAPLAATVKTDTAAAGAAANTYETINVAAAGATFLSLADGTSGILSTTAINVVGAGATSLFGGGIAENFSNVKTINAATQTGGLTVTGLATGVTGLLSGAVLTSFKGGTGADSVDLSFMTAAQLQAITATNLDGGTGRDTLLVSTAEANGTVAVNNSGFEILSIQSAAATGITFDYSKWGAGIDTIAMNNAQTGAGVFNNLTTGLTFNLGAFQNTQTEAFTAAGTGLTDAITVNFAPVNVTGAQAMGSHTFTGFETITETLGNAAAMNAALTLAGTTATASAGAAVTHNLVNNFVGTGAAALTITTENVGTTGTMVLTGSSTIGLALGGLTAGTLNASGFNTAATATTVGLNMTGAATSQISMLGSNGLDTLRGSGVNDTINAAPGNDNLRGNAGADTLTGGTGNDSFFLASLAETQGVGFAAANTTFANIDSITDFNGNGAATADGVVLGVGANAFGTALTFTGATTATVTAVTIATAGTYTALAAAVQAASPGVVSTAAVAQIYDVTVLAGTMAGRVMIVNDDTAAIAATDTFVNITGITGALHSQDFTFAA